MEIERKYLIRQLPFSPESYPFHLIQQAYLNTDPVIRIRREDNSYYLTYKSKGLLAREEYNLPLNKESFEHMVTKIDGLLIEKSRYLIPLKDGLTAELDVFEGSLAALLLVEVEFDSVEAAEAFTAPDWFGEDVTNSGKYHNSNLSKLA